jgi:tetratricopeptide (TPR) repeat protein
MTRARFFAVLLPLLLFFCVTGCQTGRPEKAAGKQLAESPDSVEKEFEKMMEDDDAAQAEVDEWIKARTVDTNASELNMRIKARLEPVRNNYEDFLRRHPEHSRARTAYGSFLNDIHDEDAAREQLERALQSDTNNPAVYNNLANIYGHNGPVKKAFEYYQRAVELSSKEPIYYENFATTVYLFRKDAREYYNIDEQQVFTKAMGLYSNAMRLDPTNFTLASDVAQTYYAIKPWRFEDALRCWTNAYSLAHDDLEREGVHIHFARVKIQAGRFDQARDHLDTVTNQMYAQLKERLTKVLAEKQSGINSPPPSPPPTDPPHPQSVAPGSTAN